MAGDKGMDISTVTCSEVVRGHPRPVTAFAEGYVLGLLYAGEPVDGHVGELIALCRIDPKIRLVNVIIKLKARFRSNAPDELVK
jgi:hypothetical protein